MDAKAILIEARNTIGVGTVDIPVPEPGEVLLETIVTCISPGTEMRVMDGKQPNLDTFPIIPGYSMVGRVIQRGPGTRLGLGTLVFTTGTARASVRRGWGAHVAYSVKPEENVIVIPDGLDPLEAVTAKLTAIALRGMRMAPAEKGEIVAVVGLGPIGQLSARLYSLYGASVLALDLHPSRIQIARAAGIAAESAASGMDEILRAHLPDGAGVVVEATGVPGVLPEATRLARKRNHCVDRPGPRLLVQASYPNIVDFSYREAASREMRVFFPHDHTRVELLDAMQLLATGKLRNRDLVSEVHSPNNAPELYQRLRENPGEILTAAFDWNQ